MTYISFKNVSELRFIMSFSKWGGLNHTYNNFRELFKNESTIIFNQPIDENLKKISFTQQHFCLGVTWTNLGSFLRLYTLSSDTNFRALLASILLMCIYLRQF